MKPARPRVFIGSSVESIEYANAINAKLQRVASPTLWTSEKIWRPGLSTLENLIGKLPDYDFAVLILGAEDVTASRGRRTAAPRDNIIFELGLFMAHLGRNRTFFLRREGTNLKIPSDLKGITYLSFKETPNRANEAVAAACRIIREEIKNQGFHEPLHSRQRVIKDSGHIGEAVLKWMDLSPGARKKLARSQFVRIGGTPDALMTLVKSAKKTDSILAICGYKGDFSKAYYRENFKRCKAVSRIFSYEAIRSEIEVKNVPYALDGLKMHRKKKIDGCKIEVIVIPEGQFIRDLGGSNFDPPLSFGLAILLDKNGNKFPRKAVLHWESDAIRLRDLIAIEGIIIDESQEDMLRKLVDLWEKIARSDKVLSSKSKQDKKTITALCAELEEIAVRFGCRTKEGKA